MTSVNPGPASSTSVNTTIATTTVGTTSAVALGRNAGPIYMNQSAADTAVIPSPGQGGFTLQAGLTNNISIPLPTENLFQQSQSLSNAYWSQTNLASVTDNAATDPLGGNTASAIVLGGSGGPTLQLSSAPLIAGQQYTMSVWVKGVATSIGATVSIGNFNNGAFQYSSISLTSGWQLVTVIFTPVGTTANNLFLQLAGTTLPTHYANVPFGATVQSWGWQLNLGPYKKNYVATTTTPVSDTTNYQVLGVNGTSVANPIVDFIEQTAGVFVGSPRETALSGTDPAFLIIKNASRRGPSIVIAAADSLSPYQSDYICTGTADQTAISNAIFALRGKGGTVFLRAGTYGLSASIIHDSDWTTLEGEARGFWGVYNAQYPIIAIEGWTGGVKLKCLATGIAAVTIGSNFQGNTRHQGLGLKKLYMFGYQLTGTAILDTNNSDISEITDCVIHSFSKGINVAWDTPMISGCSIQSIASDAITLPFVYGNISRNICYDIGGSGIVAAGSGLQIAENTIGHCGASGILITGRSNTIVNNTIQGVSAGSCVELNGATAINNCVGGNTISLNRNLATGETNANTTGHGIYLHASAINNAITGNTINNTNASASGYAVCLGQAGDATITGCSVIGNVITGSKWNAASATTILDSSGGSLNKVGMNAGDSRLVGTQ